MTRARSLVALLAGTLVAAQETTPPCTPSTTVTTVVTSPGSTILGSTETSTIKHTEFTTVDGGPTSTVYDPTVVTTPTSTSRIFVTCPVSSINGAIYTSPTTTLTVRAATATHNKRRVETTSLDTIMLYTCLASANGSSALTSFVPGPSGTSNPNGAITVTVAHGQPTTSSYLRTAADGSIETVYVSLYPPYGQATATSTVPYATVGRYGATTSSYLRTAADGSIETIYVSLYPEGGPYGSATATATRAYSTAVQGRYPATTSSYVLTLENGDVETVYVSLYPQGGLYGSATATSTMPYSTSIQGRYAATTSSSVTTLADGTVETVFFSLYPQGGPYGSATATSTMPYSTSIQGQYPATTSSSVITLANGTVETVFFSLYPQGGPYRSATATSTNPYATSFASSPGSSGASSGASSGTDSAASGSTSVVYATQTTVDDSGNTVTITSAAAGTIVYPPPVGPTSTTVVERSFDDGSRGYVAERYYLAGEPETTTTETLGTFRLGLGAETLAPSDLTSTQVEETTLNDGTREYTTEAVFDSTRSEDGVVTRVTQPLATLIIAPPSSSTAFTTTTAVVDGTTTVVANAIYTTTISGVVSSFTQPLGTYVYAPTSAPAFSAAPGPSNTPSTPTSTSTPCPIPTSTSTVFTSVGEFSTTVTSIDVTTTITESSTTTVTSPTTTPFSSTITETATISTLSTESYFGVYTAAITDSNGHYPVFDTYHALDFPYDDLNYFVGSDGGPCPCGNFNNQGQDVDKTAGCFGLPTNCQYNKIESCMELCIAYNNLGEANGRYTTPCVGIAYSFNRAQGEKDPALESHECYIKGSVAPHPMRNAIGEDPCGRFQDYDTISGALRVFQNGTTYPSRSAPNNGDGWDDGDGPRHGDGRYGAIVPFDGNSQPVNV